MKWYQNLDEKYNENTDQNQPNILCLMEWVNEDKWM